MAAKKPLKLFAKLQPKQGLFAFLVENSPASWLGYGGSRGGAKSGALRRIAVRLCMLYPGCSALILRRVWDDVDKNHVIPMWRDFPELFQYYKATTHCIEFPNGSRLYFDSAENYTDVQRKAFGTEFMFIFVDQAEQFSEQELTQLKTTNRWPDTPRHRCKFMLFFNPGGIGAGFLQRIFSTKEYHGEEDPNDYIFQQAYGWDNIEWCRAALTEDGFEGEAAENEFYSWSNDKRFQYYISRTQYGSEMNKLPAHMRAGQLLGDFKKFAGQYFSNFNEKVHVWKLEEIQFQPWWPRWISLDWGFQHYSAIYWHCQAGTTGLDGKPLVITYRELLKQGLSERALAEEIAAWNGGDQISSIYAGHDLWKGETSGTTKEKEMSAVFRRNNMPSMRHANINRVDGWRHMHTALDEGEWIITENCKQLIIALPQGVFDEKKNNEDILKTNDMGDDIRDSARYGVFTPKNPEDVPDSVRIQQQASTVVDPTARAIFISKLSAKNNPSSGILSSRSGARHARYANRHSGKVLK